MEHTHTHSYTTAALLLRHLERWYGVPSGCRRSVFRLGSRLDRVQQTVDVRATFASAGSVRSVRLHNVYTWSVERIARAALRQAMLNLWERSRFRAFLCILGGYGSRIRRLRVRLDGKSGECAGSVGGGLLGWADVRRLSFP
jgi:hypothetical protein